MFTGIVVGTGSLRAREARGNGFRLVLGSESLVHEGALELGESIAVSGACLTVVAHDATSFAADVSVETAEKTTLGRLRLGAEVNLERALRVGDRLGGHMVSGHVDAVAKIETVEPLDDAWLVRVEFPAELRRFAAAKGSVTLDGVSLTVNEVSERSLSVMLIPHTRAVTSLKHWKPGTPVNLELDLVARYLVNYLESTAEPRASTKDARFGLALERAGFK